MTSEQAAAACEEVILAWAYFGLLVAVVFGGLWLAVFKPWKKP